MSDPAGGMGSSLGVFFSSFFSQKKQRQLGLGRIIYKFGYPGGREGGRLAFFFPTRPGKNCL